VKLSGISVCGVRRAKVACRSIDRWRTTRGASTDVDDVTHDRGRGENSAAGFVLPQDLRSSLRRLLRHHEESQSERDDHRCLQFTREALPLLTDDRNSRLPSERSQSLTLRLKGKEELFRSSHRRTLIRRNPDRDLRLWNVQKPTCRGRSPRPRGGLTSCCSFHSVDQSDGSHASAA